jgi:hypothetical protein
MVNLLEPDPNETHLHRPLPIGDLLDHATARGMLRYRLYHGRSHLVAYRSGTASPVERLRGAATRHLVPRVAATAAMLRERSTR